MLNKTITVALVGNPNTGKSTLFNALSGLRQRVGNYPGVTVELKKGQFTSGGKTINLIDLPGTYSLAARSPDEMVTVDLLLGRRPEEPRPDVVLSIVDATNLDRHLYLTSQLLDLGEPVVVAVNMIDAADAQGIKIDCTKLSEQLGVAVIPIQANKGIGLGDLTQAVLAASESGKAPSGPKFPEAFEKEVAGLQSVLGNDVPEFLSRRLLLDVSGYVEQWLVGRQQGDSLSVKLKAARQRLTDAGFPVPAVEARTRFGWVRELVAMAQVKPSTRPVTLTDRLDKLLTHRLWGTLVFIGIMFLMFQSIFLWAKPLMDQIDGAKEWGGKSIESGMEPGPLRSLIVEGIINGVGSVLIFLPQILILFGFIAFLEDCGYMARAAFLMDRLMSRCGLSGKSFIPLLSSVACAVPGIMATRVIENRRDRLATILVAPLMSCSARLPVYVLLIGAFLSSYASWVPGLVLFGLYMIGFTVAPLVALLLKRTLLKGATPVFVMELPSYRRPKFWSVVRRMFEAGRAFVVRAGTIILAAMILVWALLYFPQIDSNGQPFYQQIEEAETAAKDSADRLKELREKEEPTESEKAETEKLEAIASMPDHLNGEWRRNSILGRTGRFLEPAFRPLGWDWKIGMAVLASFPAREVIVGTLGLIYDVGDVDAGAIGDDSADDEAKQKAAGLTQAVKDDWSKDPIRSKYGIAVAFSIMVFFALCCQCASTLVVIWRETRSRWWPLFTFTYMTALAYLSAMVVFQIGAAITDAMR